MACPAKRGDMQKYPLLVNKILDYAAKWHKEQVWRLLWHVCAHGCKPHAMFVKQAELTAKCALALRTGSDLQDP
eukprot:1145819-Pelagomonas_calceolata.AAC.1